MKTFDAAFDYLADRPIFARLACLAFLLTFWSGVYAAVAAPKAGDSVPLYLLDHAMIVKGSGNRLCIADETMAVCAPMQNYEPGIEISLVKNERPT